MRIIKPLIQGGKYNCLYHVNTRQCPMSFSKVSFFLSRAFKHAHIRTAGKMSSCMQSLTGQADGRLPDFSSDSVCWAQVRASLLSGCILAPGQPSPLAQKSVHQRAYHEVLNKTQGKKPLPRYSGQAPTVTRPETDAPFLDRLE